VEPYDAAEVIASRDRNNLYLTSCYFRDPERYKAFCAYYALMRIVDDRIDDIPDRARLSDRDRAREHRVVSAWATAIRESSEGRSPSRSGIARCNHPEAAALLEAFAGSRAFFPVPISLWDNFFHSMHWDLDHDRFETWRDFLTYAEGASVAPTTIYLLLLASNAQAARDSLAVPPGFDLRTCGRHLGRFAYLGHIVRDIAEDLRTGDRGLLYVAREDMAARGVTEDSLRADLHRGRASAATRTLVADLLGRARHYLRQGRDSMAPLKGQIGDDRAFILELIVTMYERVMERIVDRRFDPLAGQHRLSIADKQGIVGEVAGRVGFELRSPVRAPD
jgi:phytoene synthase